MAIFKHCDRVNDEFLQGVTETGKLAFATGTAIQSLIPLLVSVPRLPIVNVHELVLTGDDIIAIITAGYTFGLPVIQVSHARAVQAAEYCKDDYIWDTSDRPFHNRLLYSGVFASFQLALVAILTVLNHIFKSEERLLWACNGKAGTVWHVALFCPIPIVGLIWYSFLRCTHPMKVLSAGNRHLVVYYRQHWVDNFADLLPGFLQVLMTVYFTFLFSTLYGVSVEVAVARVVFVATFLFISRAASLCYSRARRKRDSKLLVRCKDRVEMKKVKTCWSTRNQPKQQSSERPGPVITTTSTLSPPPMGHETD
ncbi:hypothetical protein B0O99DRAFT_595443 [Bisporella sp. PMI_857]|nr:hypothetical protein B0O99DRAFT_595443 [Bisporella sp. PMI_857]